MGNEREKAVLHLLFLASTVGLANIYNHITSDEAALHYKAITEDIVRVCDGELKLEDVEQEELVSV